MIGLSVMNGEGATENVDEDHSKHFDKINLLLHSSKSIGQDSY